MGRSVVFLSIRQYQISIMNRSISDNSLFFKYVTLIAQ